MLRTRAGVSAAQVERACGLPRGVISHVEAGRIYAYPKLRRLVASYLSARLDRPADWVHELAFPGAPAVPVDNQADSPMPEETAAALREAGIDPVHVQHIYRSWLASVCGPGQVTP